MNSFNIVQETLRTIKKIDLERRNLRNLQNKVQMHGGMTYAPLDLRNQLDNTEGNIVNLLEEISRILKSNKDLVDNYIQHEGTLEVTLIDELDTTDTPPLTPSYLLNQVSPYLFAIEELQAAINQILDRSAEPVRIRSLSQNSPIEVNLQGASEAVKTIQSTIVPWRRRHAEEMARLAEQERQAEIDARNVETLEKRVKIATEKQQSEVELALKREELERLRLENERTRLQLQKDKIQMAIEIVNQLNPNLSEIDRLIYVNKLLPSLNRLTSSTLSIEWE